MPIPEKRTEAENRGTHVWVVVEVLGLLNAEGLGERGVVLFYKVDTEYL